MSRAPADRDSFYASVPVFRGFASVMDPALYQPLPDDWTLGVADIVQSTQAIAQNRYKAVNMAGAAVIAAVRNALGGRDLPYVFGGDGASFAVPPDDLAIARDALAATATWAREELDLKMRVALVPVARVREAGLDVRVARFAQSGDVAYAMFSGGGLGWAEAAMKRGEFAVLPAPPGRAAGSGRLIVPLRRNSRDPRRHRFAGDRACPRSATPRRFAPRSSPSFRWSRRARRNRGRCPASGPALRWPPPGAELEARATHGRRQSLFLHRLRVHAFTVFAWAVMRWRLRVGGFDAAKYLAEVVANSDFRKFDDGLRMILDCDSALADAIESRLVAAAAAGAVRYGMHRQDAAMMTCFVPSHTASDHVHFVDGARGGYASAAAAMKAAKQGTRIEDRG